MTLFMSYARMPTVTAPAAMASTGVCPHVRDEVHEGNTHGKISAGHMKFANVPAKTELTEANNAKTWLANQAEL